MDFRLAVMHDLPQLKRVYSDIIQNMNQNQIEIWDDIYPCEFFSEDIRNNRLLVVDINKPAIHLYIKNGFVRKNGAYDEMIDGDFILHEYGFEAKLLMIAAKRRKSMEDGHGVNDNVFLYNYRNVFADVLQSVCKDKNTTYIFMYSAGR